MNLIAIETSSERCSLALWCDGVLHERSANGHLTHSEQVLLLLREALDAGGLSLRQIDAIAYGAGPGAFTGLRLACGVAQGLAFGADLPVIGICSLEAIAFAAAADGSNIYVCVDARMNEVYFAAYRVAGDAVTTLIEPGVAAAEYVPLPQGEGWRGAGSGFAAYGEILRQRMSAQLAAVDPQVLPSAAVVARLAAPRLRQDAGQDAALAWPLYVRDKVALTTAERQARGGRA